MILLKFISKATRHIIMQKYNPDIFIFLSFQDEISQKVHRLIIIYKKSTKLKVKLKKIQEWQNKACYNEIKINQ